MGDATFADVDICITLTRFWNYLKSVAISRIEVRSGSLIFHRTDPASDDSLLRCSYVGGIVLAST